MRRPAEQRPGVVICGGGERGECVRRPSESFACSTNPMHAYVGARNLTYSKVEITHNFGGALR